MREFEEFEGLTGQAVDENVNIEETDDADDPSFRPANAAALAANDIYYEMDKRGLKTTGFPDTDREILQRAFDEEFKNDLEEMKAKKREKQRKAAQQLGLQRRRMLMEKTLQEEQDELARDHQVGLVIDFIKQNMVNPSLRLEINSISARSLAKALWVNDTVTCLDLSSNDLNDHAGSYLARVLKRNSSLRKIELDNNKLGPKSCQAFGESLMTNTSLIYLSLDSNPIVTSSETAGLKALAEAIKVNTTLTSLNLWRTGITVECGHMLANGVELNDTLLFCDIGHNEISMNEVKRIATKLDENLTDFEQKERVRRNDAATEEERQKKKKAAEEEEIKQRDLAKWLQEKRDQRAEDRIVREQERIIKMQEDLAEYKRQVEMRKEEERKVAEELAAKKAKKKDKGKGKKK